MTCKFLFCFWSDSESQLVSYTELVICFCVADKKCVNTLTMFNMKAKGLYQEGILH